MENKMSIFQEYHICRTGKLQQHFTLYITRNISYNKFFNQTCYYQQNLGYDRDIAIDKVEKMISDLKSGDIKTSIDFCDSKKREYCDLEAFGFKWKKTNKGFSINISMLDESSRTKFWNIWREKKSIMKKAGFKVFKGDYDFYVFFSNCSNEEMYEKLSLLDVEYEISGNHIGDIKERIRDIDVKCTNVYKINTDDGYIYKINFKTKDGENINTTYTGYKYTPEENKNYKLTATVKKHTVCDFINTTIVNRIILK